MIPLKINGKHLVDIFGRNQFVRYKCEVIKSSTFYFIDYINSRGISLESIETENENVPVNEITLYIYDRHTKKLNYSDVGAYLVINPNGLISLFDDANETLYEIDFQAYLVSDIIITFSVSNLVHLVYSNLASFMNYVGGFIDVLPSEATSNQVNAFAMKYQMFPTSVNVSSETYSRDAERKANYELEDLQLVNAKSKPEFTWSFIKASYVNLLLEELQVNYVFKDEDDNFILKDAPIVLVSYWDFVGMRIINAYTGQSLSGELVEYEGELYWKDFRIAFPER